MVSGAGSRALRRILAVAETMPGVAEDLTTRTATPANPLTPTTSPLDPDPYVFLVGTLGMRMAQELYRPDDLETGRFASFDRSEVIRREVGLPFEADANYDQLSHLLAMAFSSPGTAGSVTGTTGFVYSPALASQNILTPYTLIYGDDTQAWMTNHVLCRQLEFSGQAGEVLRVSADLFGREMLPLLVPASPGAGTLNPTTTAMTHYEFRNLESALNYNPPFEAVKTAAGALFVGDDFLAVRKSHFTEYDRTNMLFAMPDPNYISATVIDFNYRCMLGVSPVMYLDNRLDFSEVAQGRRHVELDMTVGFNNEVANTWYDYFRLQTVRTVGLQFGGSASVGAAAGGGIATATLVAAGSGYSIGDILTVVGGTGTLRVNSVSFGAVTTLSIVSAGSGYTAGTLATTSTGGGSGATVTITVTTAVVGTARQLALRLNGHLTEFNELTEREGQNIVRVKWVSAFGGGSAADARDMEIEFIGA